MDWLSFRILSPGFGRSYYRHPPRSSRNDARETRGRHTSDPSGTPRCPVVTRSASGQAPVARARLPAEPMLPWDPRRVPLEERIIGALCLNAQCRPGDERLNARVPGGKAGVGQDQACPASMDGNGTTRPGPSEGRFRRAGQGPLRAASLASQAPNDGVTDSLAILFLFILLLTS